jgi:hypothetical protein
MEGNGEENLPLSGLGIEHKFRTTLSWRSIKQQNKMLHFDKGSERVACDRSTSQFNTSYTINIHVVTSCATTTSSLALISLDIVSITLRTKASFTTYPTRTLPSLEMLICLLVSL